MSGGPRVPRGPPEVEWLPQVDELEHPHQTVRHPGLDTRPEADEQVTASRQVVVKVRLRARREDTRARESIADPRRIVLRARGEVLPDLLAGRRLGHLLQD